MYTFATSYLGFYHNAVPDAVNFYKSSSYSDDLAWAAIWLHTRTASSVSSGLSSLPALHTQLPPRRKRTWSSPGLALSPIPSRARLPQDVAAANKYLSEARMYYARCNQDARYSWDSVYMGVSLMLYKLTPSDATLSTRLEYAINSWVNGHNGITITPKVGGRERRWRLGRQAGRQAAGGRGSWQAGR